MPIAALPPDTVRSIGSTQALTDSCSLVKELVDNALDARASTISVETSVNTLDVIQVKDNGHGIAPDDRSLVCHRYCTSKVRDFQDVANVGGVSLGFRGEALASAAEMSNGLVLSTRVEGEPVAISMKLDRQSQIISQERVSHPIGTTVHVKDFLKNLPVRKQTALKVSAKMNAKIKRTLQAYALARPSVRFSLKVLKARDDKGNWTYAPKAGSTVTDAALKVLNLQAVGQCQWQVWTGPKTVTSEDAEGNDFEPASYKIEALLPKPQCDIKTVSHTGQYVSIDSRPVSCTRGVLKQVVTLFKSYLRSANSAEQDSKIIDPILCMNVICPRGSYDANAEPAKDDVLFTDVDGFLRMVECFFEEMYGKLSTSFSEGTEPKERKSKQQGFDLLLSRKHCQLSGKAVAETTAVTTNADGEPLDKHLPRECLQPNGHIHQTYTDSLGTAKVPKVVQDRPANPPIGSINNTKDIDDRGHANVPRPREEPAWRPNKYNVESDSEDCESLAQESLHLLATNEDEEEDALRDVHVSNPWTIAKVNAPIRRAPLDQSITGATCLNGQLLTPSRQKGDIEQNDGTARLNSEFSVEGNASFLPIQRCIQPRESSSGEENSPDRFSFPVKAWGPGNRDVRINHQDQSTRKRPGNKALDDWVQKSRPAVDDFVSARSLPTGTPLSAIPEVLGKQRKQARKHHLQQKGVHQPFWSPVNDPYRVWFDTGSPRKLNGPRKSGPQNDPSAAVATADIRETSEDEDYASAENSQRTVIASAMHPDLAITMDYEARKQAAMQKRRATLLQNPVMVEDGPNSGQAVSSTPVTTSPHKNRYNKAVAALNPAKTAADRPAPTFADGDPRAYLLRLQQSEDIDQDGGLGVSRNKLKRRKTILLPLETVPANETVHDLVFTVDLSQRVLHDYMTKLASCDDYIRSGEITRGFVSIKEEIEAWEVQLQRLILGRFQTESGEMANITLDLGAILQNHETNMEK
ncbi:MAG: hypothetical protein Q9187_004785 [Circinaria calcarea]